MLSATHAAGRWEYGTFDFRRAGYQARGGPTGGLSDDVGDGGIVDFLQAFPNPLLAVGLFTMLDGIRIDSRLYTDFPGLRSVWDRLSPAYATRASATAAERLPEELIEALFLVSIGNVRPGSLPPRLARHAGTLHDVREQLSERSADVYDSARLTASLYWTLTAAAAVYAGEEGDDVAGIVELGGATAIDPLEHLDAEAVAPSPKGAESPRLLGPQDPAVQQLTLAVSPDDPDGDAGGMPLTPEEIRQLIEHGVDLRISSAHGDQAPSLGLYITTLLGKLASEDAEELRRALESDDPRAVRAWLAAQRGNRAFFYDEWDYRVGDYRRRWCRLTEEEISGDGGPFFHRVVSKSRDLLDSVRREFRMMRPEQFRKVRGMQHGDDFDLNALVDAQADRRRRKTTSERLYLARLREERDVATLFLLDMSASTDEPLPVSPGADEAVPPRRVIDVTKETLVVMASVLDEIGDAYAVYGFSGHGRANVEFYRAKSFAERLSSEVKSRLGGIEPKRSTRMGAALRHAATKMARVSARARHLILLSDGFPQDYDYGDDRTSNVYGLRDTTVALQELESQGVRTFCITVDPAGHDYLREMCSGARYAVIEDVEDLPFELPRIYRTVTRL